ncbi:MAG: iron-containing alcohol dehydrogenase family protein [Erysipelotrichaceae bacterium]
MYNYLPQYTYGVDAYKGIDSVVSAYGNNVALIYGEKAFKAAKDKLLPNLSNLNVVYETVYGKEASKENAERIINELPENTEILFGIGGGKCLDTVKYIAEKTGLPVFSFPTIASTCAAVTKISILYTNDHVFDEIVQLHKGPDHCFIDTEIIAESPDIYLWAGIGDTLAKYVECTFSARGDILNYEQEFGVNTSRLCFYPMLKDGYNALQNKKKQEVNAELEKTILNIIISTGTVSICVGEDYNSAVAHALNYGLSCRSVIESKHLHGEVVSYGVLVQLLLDNQKEEFNKAYEFYKQMNFPRKLKDLDIDLSEGIDDILDITVINKELEHVPYKVTKEMLLKAITELEEM